MARTVDLEKEIAKILTEYGDEVADHVKEATKKVAKVGANAVKANAQGDFGGTGRYAKGWTSQIEENHYSAQGIIYNKDLPGLPHLLEKGHAKRGGGRVEGVVHIEPVEKQVIEEFENSIKRAI